MICRNFSPELISVVTSPMAIYILIIFFLFITIAILPSSKQKETINDLIDYGKYKYMSLSSYNRFIKSLPNKTEVEKMFPNNYCDKGWGHGHD